MAIQNSNQYYQQRQGNPISQRNDKMLVNGPNASSNGYGKKQSQKEQ